MTHWLSNDYPATFWVSQKEWPTVTHYWHAVRAANATERAKVLGWIFPEQVRKEAENVRPRQGWDEVKRKAMLKGLRAKFSQNPFLAALLIATQDEALITKDEDGVGTSRLLTKLRRRLKDGELRGCNLLTVEFAPTGACRGLKAQLTPEDWTRIKHLMIEKADGRCAICGGPAVRCREVWRYKEGKDISVRVQEFLRFQALCAACYETKRIRKAKDPAACKRHMAKVNGWTERQVEGYIQSAETLCKWRSNYPWTTDLKVLQQYIHP